MTTRNRVAHVLDVVSTWTAYAFYAYLAVAAVAFLTGHLGEGAAFLYATPFAVVISGAAVAASLVRTEEEPQS